MRLPALDHFRAALEERRTLDLECRYRFVPESELLELRAAVDVAGETGDRSGWERLERRARLRRELRTSGVCYQGDRDCPVPGGCLVAVLDCVDFEEHIAGRRHARIDLGYWAQLLHRGAVAVDRLSEAVAAAREHYADRERRRAAAPQTTPPPPAEAEPTRAPEVEPSRVVEVDFRRGGAGRVLPRGPVRRSPKWWERGDGDLMDRIF